MINLALSLSDCVAVGSQDCTSHWGDNEKGDQDSRPKHCQVVLQVHRDV